AASAGDDRTVRLWELSTGRLAAQTLPHRYEIQHASFSPDGRRLAVAGLDFFKRKNGDEVSIWSSDTGKLLDSFPHPSAVRVAFSPDGGRSLVEGWYAVRVGFDAGGIPPVLLEQKSIFDLTCFSPDGAYVLTTAQDRNARLWEAATGRPLTPPVRH